MYMLITYINKMFNEDIELELTKDFLEKDNIYFHIENFVIDIVNQRLNNLNEIRLLAGKIFVLGAVAG